MGAHIRPEQLSFPFEDLAGSRSRRVNWPRCRLVFNAPAAEQVHLPLGRRSLPLLRGGNGSVESRENASAVAELIESAGLRKRLKCTPIGS